MPYRETSSPPAAATASRAVRPATFEEGIIYAMLVFFGAIPVCGPLIDGTEFGAAPTIGLVLAMLGVCGFAVMATRRWRHRAP
ncbi:MAG: hypothetical protein K8W52_45895 [Deltaproteobacteria bacterium]|nr:hypothetical protein [Deltaproteobacteria bacterium]